MPGIAWNGWWGNSDTEQTIRYNLSPDIEIGSPDRGVNVMLVVDIAKALLEIAGLALLGQGLLYLLAGAKREQNPFYRLLAMVTAPAIRLTRLLTPRIFLDQHLGLLAFLFLGLGWFFVLTEKQSLCLAELSHPSCSSLAAEYVKRCREGQGSACELLERQGLIAPDADPKVMDGNPPPGGPDRPARNPR